MPHLIEIGPKRDLASDEGFPFSVPAIRSLPTLHLDTDVTLFVGENGSGKSTLLEAVAHAAELRTLGSTDVRDDPSLAQQRLLASALRLAWRPRSRKGFFLRAEDFFGYHRSRARDDARMRRESAESRGAAEVAGGARHPDEENAGEYIGRYDSRSHGESYLDLFASRLEPRGLYLLDEPEAPLSPMRQLDVLALIVEATRDGAQFIIATHSPVLLACPGARIYGFDRPPIHELAYDDLEHVHVMKNFLNDPAAYLARLS